MAKRAWNDFIEENPGAVFYGAVVSSRLPPGLKFDISGKKLPTPYNLFGEWLSKSMTGSWSITTVPLGLAVGVVEESDRKLLLDKYGPARSTRFKIGQKSVQTVSYNDGKYASLASELGYSLDFRTSGARDA